MKTLFSLIASLFLSSNFVYGYSAISSKEVIPDYIIGTSKIDSSLKENEAIYTFTFHSANLEVFQGKEIIYQIDTSDNRKVILDKNGVFQVKTIAGKHRFIIYFDGNHQEIYTSEILVLALNNLSISLNLSYQYYQMQEKPVIYLYPQKTTKISVKVEPKGEFTYTYPKYENGWVVTAQANGKISHKGNLYNYLFWEAKQKMEIAADLYSEGFVIDGSNTQEFLEHQLISFGFTSEEKADFITFWGPRIATNEKWFIRFVVNEECDQFADLKIEPKPEHVYRFYILAKPLSSINETISPKAQIIEPIKREGFVVFEWGGSML